MKIAVLGYGHIGGTLGTKWARARHQVRFGVRNPQKPEVRALLASLGERASASSIPDAIAWGEAVLFAIPGSAMKQTIAEYAKALDGKILIDATNSYGGPSLNNQATLAAQTPHAYVFRAFNNYTWEILDNPTYGSGAADLFYSGPDGEPGSKVEKLITDAGLNPVLIGGPEAADTVDHVLRLVFALSNGRKMGRNIAFKLLTR